MSARDRFELTRDYVRRLHEIKLLIMYGCDDWKPPRVKARHEMSDPTANKAVYNVDELGPKLDALRREEAELTEFIGVSLAIIQGVKVGFGEIYANLLEWRYIDCLTWRVIHDDHGITKSTGHYLLGIAFDWIDSVGISRLLKGEVDV